MRRRRSVEALVAKVVSLAGDWASPSLVICYGIILFVPWDDLPL